MTLKKTDRSANPKQLRPWVVRTLDPWYAAFKPAPTGKLVLAPDQRVRIW